MLTDEEMHQRMAAGWSGGKKGGTVCGCGSLPRYTQAARRALLKWTAKYQIQTVNDAGAGDLKWKEGFKWPVDYRAYDLIPRHPDVVQLDITTQAMRPCDLILCRAVLNHLDEGRMLLALEQFKKSGTYLAATQYAKTEEQPHPLSFWRLDLRKLLGPHLEVVEDLNVPEGQLALWDLRRAP